MEPQVPMEQEMQTTDATQAPDDMTPEDAKAALGLGTRLQEGILPKAPVEQEMPQGQEETPDMEEVMNTKMDDLRKEIRGMIKDEIGGLKDELKSALDEEDED